MEGLRYPKILDHVRYCVLLYAILALVGYFFVVLPGVEDGAGSAIAFMVFVSAGCAILINALMLAWQRRRFAGMGSRGGS